MKVKRFLSCLWLAAVMVSGFAGCGVPRAPLGGVFGEDGIPLDAYRVGGGFQIRYIAPAAGAAYLVERQTGALLGTESLQREQLYEFIATSEVIEEFRRVEIDISRSEFVLYFVPASMLYRR